VPVLADFPIAKSRNSGKTGAIFHARADRIRREETTVASFIVTHGVGFPITIAIRP
jgi:hypothetical protein